MPRNISDTAGRELARATLRLSAQVIARVATHNGQRQSLGWVQDAFVLELVDALEEQGVPRRVTADMLGMSRRTLQRRIQAVRSGAEAHGLTSWSRVHRLVSEAGPITMVDLVDRVPGVPADVVASLVHDMLRTGWLQERRDRFIARPPSTLDIEAIALLLHLRRDAGEPLPEVDELAETLGLSTERAIEVLNLAHGSRERIVEDPQNRWAMLRTILSFIEAFLLSRLDDRTDLSDYNAWVVSLEDRPPGTEAILRETLDRATETVRDSMRPSVRPNTASPSERRWVSLIFDCVLEPEEPQSQDATTRS